MFLRRVSADPDSFAEYWGNILLTTVTFGSLLVGALVLIGHFALDSAHASLVLFIAIGDTICQQLTARLARFFKLMKNSGLWPQ